MKNPAFILIVFLFIGLHSFSQQSLQPHEILSETNRRGVSATRYTFYNLAPGNYEVQLQPQHVFSCLGSGWKINQNISDLSQLQINFRTRKLNDNWDAWQVGEADFYPEDTPTEMYWTDALFTLDATSHHELEIFVHIPVFTEKWVIDVFDGNEIMDENHPVQPIEIGNARSCPPFPQIIPRSSWCGGAAPCSSVNAGYTVTNINATHIVIHHGASPNTYTDAVAVVRSYWNYHVNSLGWVDIGYNYLIDKYGNFYQGRHNPNLPNTDVRGAHAGNANSTSIGINFLGNLDVSIATPQQLDKLHRVMAWWFVHKSLDPLEIAGMQTQAYGYQQQPRITYHNAIGNTTCPGTDMISRMPNIRLATKAIIDSCTAPPDLDPPYTQVTDYPWKSSDFKVNFEDEDAPDGSGVRDRFYQTLDFNGSSWNTNTTNGFIRDDFSSLNASWTTATGTWNNNSQTLNQTDASITNTNIYFPLPQTNQTSYLYHWKAFISGSGTNKRSGLHFFVDSPTLTNRGNSYLAWYRDDNNRFELYRTNNDVLNLVLQVNINIPTNTWFDCKVIYHPSTGVIMAYLNDQLIGSYTDPSPLQTGGFVSFRNGDCIASFDDFRVYKSRGSEILVKVGNNPANDFRYESPNPNTPAGRVYTLLVDHANNWSSEYLKAYKIDWTAPSTQPVIASGWKTNDFTTNFNDADNSNGSGVLETCYLVSEITNNTESTNFNRGYFIDDFTQLSSNWQSVTGTWNIQSGTITQTNQSLSNTNIFAPLNQNLSDIHVYQFDLKIEGSGSNRRGGFHYFCDQPTLTNRGNSYFIWFRIDQQTLEFYKVTNDTFSQEKVVPITISSAAWYNITLVYNKVSGTHRVYMNNQLAGTWTDPFPIQQGDYISFRNGNSLFFADNLKVFRSRNASVIIQVGNNSTDDIRFCNDAPTLAAGKIYSLITDSALNVSLITHELTDIDFTAPDTISWVNDGLTGEIDTFYTTQQITAHWNASQDINSGIAGYEVSVGLSPGATNVVNWTNVGNQTQVSLSSLSLIPNTMYYVNVRAINHAGLYSSIQTSNGQFLLNPATIADEVISGIHVYPNPLTEQLFIQWDASTFIPQYAEIYDALGRLLWNTKITSENSLLVISIPDTWSKGIYSLKLSNQQQSLTIKLIK
ncbi:MAG: N-acetylmuramoyl-L-alanine amidase [Flavobacteriales bacterium]|nr:N-acetylmuramoyl-L-alanine amidase [Flavobacteriales bacterium]